MDLYAGKAGLVATLAPLVGRLARSGVAPDALTLGAIPVAFVAAACLLASPATPVLALAVPVLAAVRLLLNLLDGALARATGRIHSRGELYNEVGDRLADIAFLAPPAVLPGASAEIVLAGVVASVLASFISVATKAAGGTRTYRGVLSKPGRMVLVSACAVGWFVAGSAAWSVFGPLLLAGATLTAIERVVIAVRALP
ncbi:MAG TPA: CDP-alcohol phosphatidyltransferase family protein [Candidatus Limnocylindrales bacterium]